jgi:hypothetical protein
MPKTTLTPSEPVPKIPKVYTARTKSIMLAQNEVAGDGSTITATKIR